MAECRQKLNVKDPEKKAGSRRSNQRGAWRKHTKGK